MAAFTLSLLFVISIYLSLPLALLFLFCISSAVLLGLLVERALPGSQFGVLAGALFLFFLLQLSDFQSLAFALILNPEMGATALTLEFFLALLPSLFVMSAVFLGLILIARVGLEFFCPEKMRFSAALYQPVAVVILFLGFVSSLELSFLADILSETFG